MGSKSVLAPAHAAAPIHSVPRLSRVRPRRWHPVVYLDRGPVRFAGCDTITEAMREARKLAYALGARTWSAVPGRALIVSGGSVPSDLADGGAR
jgi:hypothetical protein